MLTTASEKCQQEKRKTVNGEDILFAMTSLGFENYGEALKIYLARYREVRRHYTSPSLEQLADCIKALIARGDQKPGTNPSGAGANSSSTPSYDGVSHSALNTAMDPAVEGANDFAYDSAAASGY